MTYRETIEKLKSELPPSTAWWPRCFYHFTDIHNALGILDKGWIYGRKDAEQSKLMVSDNASRNVIDTTNEFVKEYGRLYFRPLTPTQYHNEGYKPEHVRTAGVNASCPVPTFFCLDAEKILNLEGVEFVEGGLAGRTHQPLQNGEEAYARLDFQKIYHNGWQNWSPDIKRYRHSEIVRFGGIPTRGTIVKVFCRSQAERQTLLYLMKKQLPHKYPQASLKVSYYPNLAMFFNNGIFIKTVSSYENGLRIELNDASMRYGRILCKEDGRDLYVSVYLYWMQPETKTILDRDETGGYISYGEACSINLGFPKILSSRVLVEIKFDDCLMFENEIDLREQQLV